MKTLKNGLTKMGYKLLENEQQYKVYVMTEDFDMVGYFFKYNKNERNVYFKSINDDSDYVTKTFVSQKDAVEYMKGIH